MPCAVQRAQTLCLKWPVGASDTATQPFRSPASSPPQQQPVAAWVGGGSGSVTTSTDSASSTRSHSPSQSTSVSRSCHIVHPALSAGLHLGCNARRGGYEYTCTRVP
eukprot:5417346-Prymnesium_polylepis.1